MADKVYIQEQSTLLDTAVGREPVAEREPRTGREIPQDKVRGRGRERRLQPDKAEAQAPEPAEPEDRGYNSGTPECKAAHKSSDRGIVAPFQLKQSRDNSVLL